MLDQQDKVEIRKIVSEETLDIRQNVSTLQQDVDTLKHDVSDLKQDVSGLKTTTVSLKEELKLFSYFPKIR